MIRERINKRDCMFLALFYLLLSAVTLSAFSYSTSPLWPNITYDQSIFSAIGKNWAEGLLPYATLWDCKGPVIFFMNMLGHTMSEGETGTFLLQTLNLTAVLLLSYFMLRRHCTQRHSLAFTLLFLITYIVVNSGGNTVSEWTLLLSVASVFFVYRWSLAAEEKRYEHPWSWSVVYGMFFASCLLSRLTNATMLGVSVVFISLVLIYKGLWRNFLYNVLAFLSGFALVFVPFAAYFAAHDLFGDMWYAMFTYSVDYALHAVNAGEHVSLIDCMKSVLYYQSVLSMLLCTAIIWCVRRRTVASLWFVASLFTLLWLLKANSYAHYVISFIPVVYVALIELSRLKNRLPVARYAYGLVVCVVVASGLLKGVLTYRAYPAVPEEYAPQKRMADLAPHDETFVGYNCIPALYTKGGKRPSCPFFIFQDWMIQSSESLRAKVVDCYEKGDVQWILVSDYEHCAIKDVLDRRYQPVRSDEANDLILFRLN